MVLFGIIFIILGSIFLLLGITSNEFRFFVFVGPIILLSGIWLFVLIRRNKKLAKTKSELKTRQSDAETEKTPVKKSTEDEERETIENIVFQNSIFNNGKLIHCGRRNSIVFNRTGEVGIFTDEIDGIKIMNINDIKSIKYQMEKDNWGTKTWYCVINTKDFDNPMIKILLSFVDINNSKELYEEIKQYYSILKDNKKNDGK